MNITDFIKKIQSKGITVTIESGDLKISSPKGVMTKELISEFKEHKSEIIRLFSKNDTDTIPLAPLQHDYTLSFEQRRIWLLSQTDEGNKAYVIYIAFDLRGTLDLALLHQAIAKVADKHEILRTNFSGSTYEQVRQHVVPADSFNFDVPFHDFSSKENPEEAFEQLFNASFEIPFNFDSVLFRVEVVKTGHDHHIMYALMHHIIIDGWSSQILFHEIMEVYSRLVLHKTTTLVELPFQYKDFAAWQNGIINSPELQKQRQYWLSQFSGEIPVLELPESHKRPIYKSFSGRNISHTYSKEFSNRLKKFSSDQGVSVFTAILTGINILLYRYTNQNDIIIGTPVTTRFRKELENQVGIYQNTLALRTRFQGAHTVEQTLRTVEKVFLDGYSNNLYPLDLWITELDLKANPGRSPLFDVMVVFQGEAYLKETTKTFSSLVVEPRNAHERKSSKFDLLFEFFETKEGLMISVDYNPDIFEAVFIQRLVAHFENLLNEIFKDHQVTVDQLNYLTKEEKVQLIETFNDTETGYPKEKNVIDLLHESVKLNPGKEAVFFHDQSFTYQEIDTVSNQFANFLLDHFNIEKEELIGVVQEKSILIIPVLLGILKTGAAYVPIDITYPEERIQYLKESVNCKIVVDDALLSRFLSIQNTIRTDMPLVSITADCLFHVMFTSGTTGNPKGVMLTHKNIVRLIEHSGCLDLNEDTILLSTVSISFDTTNTEFWTVLAKGGQVILAERKELLDYVIFKNILQRHQVNTLWLTASWFQHIVENDPDLFSGLKQFISGGDIVSSRHVGLLKELYPDLKIINGYGPTENTTFSTFYQVDNLPEGTIPIGKPLNNSQVYILNDALIPQPAGVVGTLYVAGDGLAPGYYNKPELTAEKFISNPFKAGKLMYNSGDSARWLPDGNIEFLGRKDDMVKIRGRFIDTTEIENSLCKIRTIKQAVVLVKTVNGEKKIIAYLVCAAAADIREIKEELKKSLADFMVPNSFVCVASIPLSHNGKVDRAMLLATDSALTDQAAITYFVPASTETEEKVIGLFKEVLKLEQAGRNDDFFELGGYSLTSITLLSRIAAKFGKKITIRDLYQNSSVASLAKFLDSSVESTGIAIIKPVEAIYYPLTLAQNRMWINNQLHPGNATYSTANTFELRGEYVTEELFVAFRQIIDRHHLLRSVFPFEEGEPMQKVLTTAESIAKIFELISWNKEEIFDVQNYDQEQTGNYFELTEDPPLRIKIITVSKQQAFIWIQLHHIAYDAWSIQTLYSEFRHFLESAAQPEPLEIQFKHFAFWQRDGIEKGIFASQLNYWQELLKELPAQNERKLTDANDVSAVKVFEIDEFSSHKLRKICIDNHLDEAYLFLGLFSLAYSAVFNQEDYLCNFPYLGRKNAQLQKIIGLFYQIMILRIRTGDEGEDVLAFISLLQKQALDAVEQLDYPFEKLIDEIPGLAKHINTLSFNVISKEFINVESDSFNQGKLTITPLQTPHKKRFRTDLTIDLYKSDKFYFSCAFNAQKYNAIKIESLLDLTRGLLEEAENVLSMTIKDLNFKYSNLGKNIKTGV
jgi:surfactin family lipopeptide synthetase A